MAESLATINEILEISTTFGHYTQQKQCETNTSLGDISFYTLALWIDISFSFYTLANYNRILLCDWVIELCSVRLIDGVSSHSALAFYLD